MIIKILEVTYLIKITLNQFTDLVIKHSRFDIITKKIAKLVLNIYSICQTSIY